MATYTVSCARCGASYEAGSTKGRFCSNACRAAYRRGRLDTAVELLKLQTAAIESGDPQAVAEVARRVRRHFADA